MKIRIEKLVMMAATCTWSGPSLGWGLDDPYSQLQRLPVAGRDIRVTPGIPTVGTELGLVGSPVWNRLRRESQPIEVLASQILRNSGLANTLGLVQSSVDGQMTSFQFTLNGTPLCDYKVKGYVHPEMGFGMFGTMPSLDDSMVLASSQDWPDEEDAKDIVAARFSNSSTPLQFLRPHRCWQVVDSRLRPVWEMIVRADDLPYLVRADAYELLHTEVKFISVAGEAKVYEHNPTDGSKVTFQLELKGDGTLSSDFLTTKPSVTPRATAQDNKFNFSDSDPQFGEASSFAHATSHLAWFAKQGYTWKGPKPLVIRTEVDFNGNPNNALYQPPEATSNGLPTISIGAGDGKILRNLAVDSDVVQHEFGHHVVYRSLKSIEGESLVLHEGMADFFAFMHSGDSCLGESICPNNSLACWNLGKCLRNADNDLVLKTNEFNALEPHLKGQVISGVLWDLRSKQKVSPDQLQALAYKAVDYFSDKSGYADFVNSVFLADRELFNASNSCQIFDAMKARGFGPYLAKIDCKDPASFGQSPPTLAGKQEGSSTSPQAKGGGSSRQTAEKKGVCGQIGNQTSGANNVSSLALAWAAILLLLPMLASAMFSSRLVAKRVETQKKTSRANRRERIR